MFKPTSVRSPKVLELEGVYFRLLCFFLSQKKVSESDLDPQLKDLFKQLAGNVGWGKWELTVNQTVTQLWRWLLPLFKQSTEVSAFELVKLLNKLVSLRKYSRRLKASFQWLKSWNEENAVICLQVLTLKLVDSASRPVALWSVCWMYP